MQRDDFLWQHLKQVPAFRALLRAVESRFYQNLALDGPVLDLGCGDGQFAATTFAELRGPDFGVDPSWSAVEQARDRCAYQGAIQADGGCLPFAEASFGSVVCNSVLEHIPDVDAVLRQAARVLVTGGTLALTVPSEHFGSFLSIGRALSRVGLDRAAAAYTGWFNRISRHHHCDAPAVWHQRLAAAGLEVVRWHYYFSPAATACLEWGHYLGLPALVSKWVLGHWVIAPWRASLQWVERWLRPRYQEPLPEAGAYLMFVARRLAPAQLPAELPAAASPGFPERQFCPPEFVPSWADEPFLWSESSERLSPIDGSTGPDPSGAIESPVSSQEPLATGAGLRVRPSVSSLAWLVAAVLCAAIGQINWNWAKRPAQPADGFTWYILAAVALGIFAWTGRRSGTSVASARRTGWNFARWRAEWPRGAILLAGFLLSIWAWLLVQDTHQPAAGSTGPLLTWLAGIVAAVAALWPGAVHRAVSSIRRKDGARSDGTGWNPPHRNRSRWPLWEIVAVLTLVGLALLLRLVNLTGLPYVLSGDEASMGMEALRVLEGELANPFITGWFSHPTLYFFVLSLPLRLLGSTTLALRLLSVMVGSLTVLATYLFARQTYGRSVGLVSAFLLTGCHFHLHFSRLALNNVWDPLFALAVLGLFIRGWESRDGRHYVAAGLALGLSQYFYMGARMLLLLVAAMGLYWLITDRRRLWQARGRIAAMLAVALVVSLPIVLFSVRHPDDYMARVNQLGIYQSGWLEREVVLTGKSEARLLGEQIWKSSLAFNYTVDPTFWYRPGIPLLRSWPSILFVFGVVLAALSLRRTRAFVLLLWLGATILFAGVLLENPPSSQRYVIAAPAVCLLMASALVWISEQLRHLLGGRQRTWMAGVLVVALLFNWGDVSFYFGQYARNGDFGGLNTEVAQRVADYLADLGSDWQALFFGPPRMGISDEGGFPTVRFLVPEVQRQDVPVPITHLGDLPGMQSPVVFLFLPERMPELQVIRGALPGGVEKIFPGRFDRLLFVAYEVR